MSILSISSLFSVRGKVALVTGGGTGIGKMIASALAQNGAKVYIASRKLKVVQDAAAEINSNPQTKESGGSCIALQADLTDKSKADQLATEIKKREQKLHILVNNAGISWGAEIINISSIASFVPTSADPSGKGTYSYNASKAAVNHLTRVLAATLAERFVTVNAIAPWILSFANDSVTHGLDALGDAAAIMQPMGRIGTPEDMAGMALFFCSRASAHVTGQVIVSDGGSTLVHVPGAQMSKL
ncbi:hypothetical protein BDR26DRAFT_861259 [Obelidium mucronatum]|nr:hypothetical protein BDR26DRAFT_861259 [Obelidium mucronatum]